jgi:hypothetical protein
VGGTAERLKQLDQAYDHVNWFLGLGGRALGLKMISMPNASALRLRSAISSSSDALAGLGLMGWIMTTPSFGLWYGQGVMRLVSSASTISPLHSPRRTPKSAQLPEGAS